MQRYGNITLLAQGGMGVTFQAIDTVLERKIVIKTVRRDAECTSRQIIRRFREEVQTLARVEHPHVVRLYDFVEEGPMIYYTMAFLDGVSLRQRLETDEVLPVSEVVKLFGGLVDGLATIHELGVLHRDINPNNIVLADGRATFIDFGLAKSVDETRTQLTATGGVLGTLDYLPPEVIGGHEHSARSDIYQLGLVLYESLTGQCPVSAPELLAYSTGGTIAPPPPPSKLVAGIPEALDELVLQAIAVSPADRLSSARVFHEGLSACQSRRARRQTGRGKRSPALLTGSVSSVSVPVPAAQTGRSAAAKLVALCICSLLCLLAIVGYGLFPESEGEQSLAATGESGVSSRQQARTLKVVDIAYHEGDGTARVTFAARRPSRLEFEGVQAGKSLTWAAPEQVSRRFTIDFDSTAGSFSRLTVRQLGEGLPVSTPLVALADAFDVHLRRLSVRATTLQLIRNNSLQRGEVSQRRKRSRALLVEHGFGACLALLPFGPALFRSNELVLEDKLGLFDMVTRTLPIDLFGMHARTGELLGSERAVAPFSTLRSGQAGKGRLLFRFHDQANDLWPRDVCNTGLREQCRQRRLLLPDKENPSDHFDVQFTVTADDLSRCQRAVLYLETIHYPPRYIVIAEVNERLRLPIYMPPRVSNMLIELGNKDAQAQRYCRRRSFPAALLQEGRNTVRLWAEAVVGEFPISVPCLKELRLELSN